MAKKLTAIQASARGEQCTVMLRESLCSSPETTVLAHWTQSVQDSPRKHDLRACYACSECHDRLDDRTKYNWSPYHKQAVWGRAIAKTHVKLLEKGLIKIVGVEHEPNKILPRRFE